jgi:transcriptional regulator with XRE-family HTH domain
MFALGASLEEARRRQGLDLEQVGEATCIGRRYLRALEEERFELLPGDAYAKGFLRAYAEFLGLDAQRYLDEYSARLAERAPEPALVAQSLRLRRRRAPLAWLRRWQVLVGVVFAAVLGVLAWQFGGSGSSSRPLSAPTPLRSLPRPAPPKPPPRPQPTTPQPAPALSLRAVRGSCWLDVHAFTASGKLIYTGTLAEGGTLRFSLRRPLWIRLGAPRNLDATIAGKPAVGLPTQTANVVVTRTGIRPA